MSEFLGESVFDNEMLAPLAEYLEVPEVVNHVLAYEARASLKDLGTFLRDPEDTIPSNMVAPVSAMPVTPEVVARHIDPNLPTIALDGTNTYSGAELFAVAAQESRQVNVVFVPYGISMGEVVQYADGSAQLEVSRGWFIENDSTVACGKFPEPIPVDIIETTKLGLIKQLAAHGIATTQTQATIEQWADKSKLPGLLQGTGVIWPPRHSLDEMWHDDLHAEYVIKPAHESQGLGIVMFDGIAMRDQATNYYNFLQERGYDPLIESRIRSYPLIHPETGQRLDWNVRALIAQGEYIDMYVRTSKWNMPANMTAGARELLLKDLVSYGLDPDLVEDMSTRLRESAQSIARYHDTISYAGLDLTLDEKLQPYLFETNIGRTGGLQTIARLTNGREATLANARTLVSLSTPSVAKISHQAPEAERLPLTPVWSDRASVLTTMSEGRRLLATLPHDMTRRLYDSLPHYTHWLDYARHERAAKELTGGFDEALIQYNPLRVMGDIWTSIMYSNRGAEFIADFEALDLPVLNEKSWALARAYVHSYNFELDLIYDELQLALGLGASHEEILEATEAALTVMASALGYRKVELPHHELMSAYGLKGYEQAKAVSETQWGLLKTDEDVRLMRQLCCRLAFTHGDLDTYIEHGRALLAENPDDPVVADCDGGLTDVMRMHSGIVEFSALTCAVQRQTASAFVGYRRVISGEDEVTPDTIERVRDIICEHAFPNATALEQQWLRTALENWDSFFASEAEEWQLPPHWPSTGIADILMAFWAFERRQPSVMRHFAKRASEKFGEQILDLDLLTTIATALDEAQPTLDKK